MGGVRLTDMPSISEILNADPRGFELQDFLENHVSYDRSMRSLPGNYPPQMMAEIATIVELSGSSVDDVLEELNGAEGRARFDLSNFEALPNSDEVREYIGSPKWQSIKDAGVVTNFGAAHAILPDVPIGQSSISDNVRVDTPENLVSDLLGENRGIAIGDTHNEFAITDFLQDQMSSFKQQGVEVLFFEMIEAHHQANIDEYMRTGNPEIIDKIMSGGWEIGPGKNPGGRQELFNVLEVARENGIRIVGIDDSDTVGPDRFKLSNPIWSKNISLELEKQPPNAKYVVFGGYLHFQKDPSPGQDGSFDGLSVSDKLGIPSVKFDTSPTGDTSITSTRGNQVENDFFVQLPESPRQQRSMLRADFKDAQGINKALVEPTGGRVSDLMPRKEYMKLHGIIPSDGLGEVDKPIVGGVKSTAVKAAAALVAVGVFLQQSPASAAELPLEVREAGDIDGAAKAYVESGVQSGIFERFGYAMGDHAPEVLAKAWIKGTEVDSELERAEIIANELALGLGIPKEDVRAAYDMDADHLVLRATELIAGKDTADQIAQSGDSLLTAKFALANGDISGLFQAVQKSAYHNSLAVKDAAMHLGGNDIKAGWDSGDSTVESLTGAGSASLGVVWGYTGGEVIETMGLARDASLIAWGLDPAEHPFITYGGQQHDWSDAYGRVTDLFMDPEFDIGNVPPDMQADIQHLYGLYLDVAQADEALNYLAGLGVPTGAAESDFNKFHSAYEAKIAELHEDGTADAFLSAMSGSEQRQQNWPNNEPPGVQKDMLLSEAPPPGTPRGMG